MIYSKVNEIIKKKNNTVRLDIITTEKIDEKISNKIKNTVSDSMKKSVEINNIIDKSIIGGMILKIDSYMIDGSISTKTSKLQKYTKRINLMTIDASEISEILKKEISEFDNETKVTEVGTVLNVGDGIARVYGLIMSKPAKWLNFLGKLKGWP